MQSLFRVAFLVVLSFGLAAPVLSTPAFAQVTPTTGYSTDLAAPNASAAMSTPAAPETTAATAKKGTSANIACDTAPKAHPLPKHHASSSKHHKTTVAHKKSKSHGEPLSVREAQEHLKNLGYYSGPIDGKIGPKTRAALKKFQKDYGLPPTGKLDAKTMAALRAADQARKVTDVGATPGSNLETPPNPAPDFYATHPDFYGYYHQHYADPMMLTHEKGEQPPTQTLPSRYAQLVLTEQPAIGSMKTYHVTLNGQPLFGTGDQPSVILISKTYQLDGEDAIVFTSYNDGDSVCTYENVLVTLKSDNTNNHYKMDNCTYGYEAEVKQNSLWIRFPEQDDKRAIGATFKYENGDMEKL